MTKKGDFKNRVGEKYITNESYEIEIIECFSANNYNILFTQSGRVLEGIQYSHIKRGQVKNPFHPSVYGVGYIGVGIHRVSLNREHTEAYKTWRRMLMRCYSSTTQEKQPTYKGCTVDERWHNYQNFAEWFENKYVKDWQLDKDILTKGNKIYSSETCCFCPSEINNLFKTYKLREGLPTGVSKTKTGKFIAQVHIEGINKRIGMFSSIEESVNAIKIVKGLEFKRLALKYKSSLCKELYNLLMAAKIV
jgi:hypothetical protein